MKTPKRNKSSHARCEFCQSVASVDNEDNENGWFLCPCCGKESKITEEFVSNPVRARWIRKNREKRLKHAIQRQAWNAVSLAADFRCAKLSADSWKRRYREIWHMQFCVTSTYGHDIEGS